MRDFTDSKLMAKSLRAAMDRRGVALTHAEALEIVAAQFGLDDWNVLSARIGDAAQGKDKGEDKARKKEDSGPAFQQAIPILRIFDEAKAKEFYIDFLGFSTDWEHRFEDHLPLYTQVSRAGISLHLTGHHGDSSPGSNVFVPTRGLREFQKELIGKNYPNMRPGIDAQDWGLVMQITDPFSNRIRFCERE